MKARLALLTLVTVLTSSAFAHPEKLCNGFVPENDRNIPVFPEGRIATGISETDFRYVANRLSQHFKPIVQADRGARLAVMMNWKDGTVNAYADRDGDAYQIHLFGGLARTPGMTVDGYQLVICHELGHHIGGAPQISSSVARWASNEGQADYYAGLRCVRELWPAAENRTFVQRNKIDPFLTKTCAKVWKKTAERDLCARTGMAAKSVAEVFRWLGDEAQAPRFETPDKNRVSATDDNHPETQCRLDTYFQSGLCTASTKISLSNSDERQGTCTKTAGYDFGNRPRCWYGGRY